MHKLPIEIISKIQLYSHPILNKNLQTQIHDYIFYKNNSKIKFCNKCLKNHRYPKHFKCF